MRGLQTIGIFGFSILGMFIAVNAMFLQPGAHPSPFGLETKSAQSKSSETKIPKPRRNPILARAKKPKAPITAPVKPKSRPRHVEINDYDRSALEKQLRLAAQKKSKPVAALEISTREFHNSKATIRLVQLGLAELGYNPGPVDGTLGQQTQVAIREFERHHKLPISGRITTGLVKELRNVTGTSVLNVL